MKPAATLAMLLLSMAACTGQDAARPAAGDAFPPIRPPSLWGAEPVALPVAGQPVVVNVWATWCEPCRREMRSLEALHRASPGGLQVVGVSVDDDRFLAQEFVRRLRLTFPNALKDAADRGALAVRTLPTTFVIDRQGVVRWREEAPRDWSSAETLSRLRTVLGEP